MYTPSWLRTVLASAAAVAVPISASAAELPPTRHQQAWAIARPPALPEFGFTPRVSAPPGDGDQSGRIFRIDIAAGTLGDAVEQLTPITGLRVRFADAGLRTLPSPRVTGSYTADQALGLLLD